MVSRAAPAKTLTSDITAASGNDALGLGGAT
jgi:hypothetical protein